MLDIKSFDPSRIEKELLGTSLHAPPTASCCDAEKCEKHTVAMETILVPMPKRFHREELDRLMRRLLWREVDAFAEMDIVRLKGVLAILDEDKKVVIQAVYQTYEWMDTIPWTTPEAYKQEAKMVVIGKRLQKQKLADYFLQSASL